MPCNRYLWPNSRNFRVIWEIGVEELDGDVRFHTRTEMEMWLFAHVQWKICNITTVIYSRVGEISASYRKLLSRSTMVTSYFTPAMGQIPCSAESIASFLNNAVKNQPILINFGIQNSEEIWHKGLWNCPSRLQNVTRLPCEIQKCHFIST